MKSLVLAVLLAVAACSSGPPALSHPDTSAAVWDLNAGRWAGTNDLVHEPTLGVR